ncbi:hypothetical protein BD324DRAFT_652162 [Kockovaella imperatae]|uniref:Alpha/beta hydrolase fold-3 domain-containing protein n=1 Tax=Kockovaella imperatae TaxID=4999 RepID=A0A1Y1UC82_9TREE|nr:hypothetical protein BD324DRAFT_652162 [Kockovaella imperatae]ORX35612.1 hypothetical protein BD324DRAFT_652162 [Kockovaella imperatae]
MSGLLTPQALATAGPLVLETFFKHYLFRNHLKDEGEAREDLMYDEAFVLMKTFMEIATKYPLAALQHFGLVRTPAPPWVGLHRVVIKHHTLDMAAEYLIEAFGGKEMAYKIAGGSKWWQVRAGPGVEAEWIITKKDWKDYQARERDWKTKAESEQIGLMQDGGLDKDGEFRKEMDELRCMLYIHGGAYYWGSINTHRYTIWRYARKMHGRCFAVNYRKAPQYPFPCAIQDCLAAYLYLVKPPPGAKHRPVSPKNIVVAGDSAGGGLVLALLQILRDTEGLDLPAGAVMISPWSDLTHSFPSILQNTATDIVPPYGFLHKPSSLWPSPPPDLTDEIQSRLRTRVKEGIQKTRETMRERRDTITARFTGADESSAGLEAPLSAPDDPLTAPAPKDIDKSDLTNPPIDSISPDSDSLQDTQTKVNKSSPGSAKDSTGPDDTMHPLTERGVDGHPQPRGEPRINPSRSNPGLLFNQLHERRPGDTSAANTTLAQCDIPLRLYTEDEDIEINTQCQIYATNAQLCHPWVSPVLGYLGGLPPLFICAGQNEVLRDEIVYVAHKAAHPFDHPIRDDVKALCPSLNGIEKRYGPTYVHLQVYDGCCHDLALFSMTKPARGLFRAIASFARYVTPQAPGSLAISRTSDIPVAESRRASSSDYSTKAAECDLRTQSKFIEETSNQGPETDRILTEALTEKPDSGLSSPIHSSAKSLARLPMTEVQSTQSSQASGYETPFNTSSRPYTVPLPRTAPAPDRGVSGDDAGPRFGDEEDDLANRDSRAAPGTAGYSGVYRGQDAFTNYMIRERVAVDGKCRPLEPESKLAAMTMPRDEIGCIKEGAALRYLNGQALWDKKFKHAIKTVQRHRKKNLKQAREKDSKKIRDMWAERAKEARAKHLHAPSDSQSSTRTSSDMETDGWETNDESALPERHHRHQFGHADKALNIPENMLDKSWSWKWALEDEAPPPSAVVSRRDFGEARRLALMADRMDSEHASPVHGLSIWVGLAAFFSSSSDRSRAHEALQGAHDAKKAEKEAKRNQGSASDQGHGDGSKSHGVTGGMKRLGKALGIKSAKHE